MPGLDDILNDADVPPEHPFFYARICTFLLRSNSKNTKTESDVVKQICAEEFDDLSRRLERTDIQEAPSVRNVLKARLIATKLIGDDGELRVDLVPQFIDAMKQKLYSLSPNRQFDAVRDKHILRVLEHLKENKEPVKILRHITRPVSNRLAEQIIRDTLIIPPNIAINDVHVRRAVLSAWLTTLRQSLGSCFATAPAILVHQEQPQFFLRDLDEMMNTGYMRRTFAGIEHSVPLSGTWGNGDLKKPLLLERNLEVNENKVWLSPGILAALDAVDFFPAGVSQNDKIADLQIQLQQVVDKIEYPGHIILTNAEELIRKLLLTQYNLTEKSVQDFLNRPKDMMQTSMLVHSATPVPGQKAKVDLLPLFLKNFEIAKTAFRMLADNALLKAWEFTVASFSEINLNFTRWNLYASLGINYDDAGGIGQRIYRIISTKVEHANAELQEHQASYEQVWTELQYLQARSATANTEKEITWLKMEYQSRQTELYHIDKMRQMAHERALKVAALNEFLINQYDRLFFDFFQEVYDADLHDVAAGPFDDCPAGFRLLYKHGRANPSLWTRINSLAEFIEALVSFFTITEAELRTAPEIKGIEAEFGLITTQIIGHVRSDEFMESAFYRMAKAHNVAPIAKPLENLDLVEKKPWVYTSGGSMSTLVSAYFRREEKPTESERWVENETELLAYFIDTVKQLPPQVSDMYLKECYKSMLMHSPTHAFLLKPGLFKEAWTSDMYTYSWIKHKLIEPAILTNDLIVMEDAMAEDIVKSLLLHVPQDFRPRFKQVFQTFPYLSGVKGLRDHILDTIHSDRGLRGPNGPVLKADTVDSVFHSNLPYIQAHKIQDLLQDVLSNVFSYNPVLQKKVSGVVEVVLDRMQSRTLLSAARLLELAKAIACLILEE
ncbi:MAG: hypothetical protein LLF94_00845, partial [Chlamydiales bacterium]|nr:hypothetical protein [Chlamydiales bacterium]